MLKKNELSYSTKSVIIYVVSVFCVFIILSIYKPIDFEKKFTFTSDCIDERCYGDPRLGEECKCLEYGESKQIPYNPWNDVFSRTIISIILGYFIYFGIDKYNTYKKTGH